MDETIQLILTKEIIDIASDKKDYFIKMLIISAKEELKDMGIILNSDTSDQMLVAQYAAWMYRTRKTGEDKPRSLQYRIHNRLLKEKGASDD